SIQTAPKSRKASTHLARQQTCSISKLTTKHGKNKINIMAFGNLVETTVNQSASTFGYDKLDRIRKEKTPTREQTYTYDESGNP
ncbi:hypothetical protein, partial [Brevibacillus laterosporus]|uniref:hypothetical protein n=1 Tax=Brevibacillus laterosporus TaxID=1465 RepID=UPI003D1B95ED